MNILKIIKSLLPILGAAAFYIGANAEKLVILHTNDTHSTIDPLANHTGGVLQRKAIIDSVRSVEKNVVLIDAGDAVQGTLYFKYFGGEVENSLMDMCGYDIRIVGNHEFDNGMESLTKYYKSIKGTPISANYDFTGTELEDIFQPFVIKEYGGKKIGFIGININPISIISSKNINAKFKEVIPAANETASYLKNDLGCDMVVVVSHIGYQKVNDKTSDIELARASKDIDLIIGGHTHTLIDPAHPETNPSIFKNAYGKNIRIVQVGSQGLYLGKLTIDLNDLPLNNGELINYELIPVTDRFSQEQLNADMKNFLAPFKAAVDSVNNVGIAYCETDLARERNGSLSNLVGDMVYEIGKWNVDSLKVKNSTFEGQVDLGIMNGGGVRHEIKKGKITEGSILSTFPFANYFVIIKVKGKDLIEALRIAALKGGEVISGNVKVVTDTNKNLKRVIINGDIMDPEKEYIVSTVDYLAQGNDDLVSLSNHELLWEGKEEIAIPIIRWIKKQNELGLKINPDPRNRFVVDISENL